MGWQLSGTNLSKGPPAEKFVGSGGYQRILGDDFAFNHNAEAVTSMPSRDDTLTILNLSIPHNVEPSIIRKSVDSPHKRAAPVSHTSKGHHPMGGEVLGIDLQGTKYHMSQKKMPAKVLPLL